MQQTNIYKMGEEFVEQFLELQVHINLSRKLRTINNFKMDIQKLMYPKFLQLVVIIFPQIMVHNIFCMLLDQFIEMNINRNVKKD